jgi:hypothetical protein
MSYAAAYRARYEGGKLLTGYGFVFPLQGSGREPIRVEFQELGMPLYIFFLTVPDNNDNDFERAITLREEILVQQITRVLEKN